MNYNRVDVKLGLTMITIFLIVFIPFGLVIDQVFCNAYYDKARQEANQLTSNYARLLAEDRGFMSIHMVEMASELTESKIFLLDEQGKMTTYTGIEGMVISIPNQEIQRLISGNIIDFEYMEPLSDIPYLLYGYPILKNDKFYGGVFTLMPLSDMYTSMNTVRQLFVLAGIGGFFLAAAFTFIASRKLSLPLVAMEKATQLIANGNLNTKVPVTSNDEIGSLARGINNLAEDLKSYRDNRSEFFSAVSHELKTPVSYVKGYAQVLNDKLYQSEEEKQQYVTIIEQEATRLNELISDLFDLSKMEEGKFEINKEWVDINDLFGNLELKYSLKAKEKGIHFKMELDEDIPLFHADAKRIVQIVSNLLDNALRYTNSDGNVIFKVELVNDQKLMFRIKDTGDGIPEEELPHIFERFYRVEKSRSREHGGTGLGLAIVKMLIEAHKGMISVKSREKEGTEFNILFPIEVHDKGGGGEQ